MLNQPPEQEAVVPPVLIFDLDRTLLNREGQVHPANENALLRAARAGTRIVIATSRPVRAVRRLVPHRLLAVCTVIGLNGAAVHDQSHADDNVSILGALGPALSQLLEALSETGEPMRYSIETDGTVFASSVTLDTATLWDIHSATPDMVLPLATIGGHAATKVAVNGLGGQLTHTLALQKQFPTLRFVRADNDTFVNIVSSRVDKSHALRWLADRDGFDLQDAIAFGDDVPDIEMLHLAGTGVAMSNAEPSVSAVADHHIGDCDSDAIARFLAQQPGL